MRIEKFQNKIIFTPQSAHEVVVGAFDFIDYNRSLIYDVSQITDTFNFAKEIVATEKRARSGDMTGEPGLFGSSTPFVLFTELQNQTIESFQKSKDKYLIFQLSEDNKLIIIDPMKHIRGNRWYPDPKFPIRQFKTPDDDESLNRYLRIVLEI
jgi:hypothetical protein